MYSFVEYLEKIAFWTKIDVKDFATKAIILQKIKDDKENPLQFNIEFYKKYKTHYSMMGQTNLELIELSKPWKKNLIIIKAICKFKKGIISKRTQNNNNAI